MSIQAIAWALEQPVPDPAAKLVLIALANAYNQQRGRCFPTVRQIMREASASERTVQRKIRVLEEMGLIAIEEARDETGRQMANEYLLNLSWEGVSVTPKGANLTGGGCQPDGGEGVTGDGGEGVSCDTPSKEPEEIPEEKTLGAFAPTEPASPDRFEEFWNAYPRRDGANPKKPAAVSFRRLVARGRDPLAIIAAARQLARQHPTATPFCPQAVTWLNQERFAEDSQAPPVVVDEAQWRKRLKHARSHGEWFLAEWGPIPGQAGSLVPASLLADGDGVGWRNKSKDAA